MIVFIHSNQYDGLTGDTAVRILLSETVCTQKGDTAHLNFERFGLDFNLPESVRMHPAMAYRLGSNEDLGLFPALVLPLQNKQGLYRAVELAFLSDGGLLAPVIDPRQQYWLEEVEQGCYFAIDPPEGTYGVAVGLGEALAARHFAQMPMCAVLSADDLRHFQVPAAVHSLVIFSDSTRTAEARHLQVRCEALGVRTHVCEPQNPHSTWLTEFALRGAVPIDEVAESRAALDRHHDDSAE